MADGCSPSVLLPFWGCVSNEPLLVAVETLHLGAEEGMTTSGKSGRFLDLQSDRQLPGVTVAVAYSGGPDATALAARLLQIQAAVVPVYVAYRGSGGGKTSKDIAAAIASAKMLRLPLEHIQSPLVASIKGDDKSSRNRLMLEAMAERFAGTDIGALGLGTYLAVHEASGLWTEESNADLDPAVLVRSSGKKGHDLITWDSFGVKCKEDEFRAMPPHARKALYRTTSCQLWFKVECGNCYSCVERHDAFMKAFRRDPTVYRPNTRITRSGAK